MFTSSLILKAYELTANSNTRDKLRYEEEVRKLLIYNKTHNKNSNARDLLIPLSFYEDLLANTQAVMFPYMNAEKKQQVLRDLQVAYLLYLGQLNYELTHQKKENAKSYHEQLKQCQDLIDALLYPQVCAERGIQAAPEQAHFSDGRPAAYTGLVTGQAFAEKMVELSSGSTTKTIRDNMGWVNEKRLYWVWASSFLKTTLALLPDDFFNIDQARAAIRMPDLYTGTMSWGLYYFRFALNLGLLLKHTIAGPWMSKEEKSEGTWERFKTQWAQRKFTLLNDSIWATGNLLCFFWLYGSGAAGTIGDVLTIALLVFDLALAYWDYQEQLTQFNQQVNDYKIAIQHLEHQLAEGARESKLLQEKLDGLQLKLDEAKEDLEAKQKLELELNLIKAEQSRHEKAMLEIKIKTQALSRAKVKCTREWNYQQMQLTVNVAYAVGLMLAFVMLAAPFLPAVKAVAAMSVVGAVLCFALSLINNAIRGGLELHKTKMTLKEVREEQAFRIQAFKELIKLPEVDANATKLMFLEIKKLRVDSEYQEKLLTLQTAKLIRSILIESIIPPLVLLSLTMVPLGIGLGILAASFGLALATHLLINHCLGAKEETLNQLDEQEYQNFCANPDNWDPKSSTSANFFKAKERPGIEPEFDPSPLLPDDGHNSPAA